MEAFEGYSLREWVTRLGAAPESNGASEISPLGIQTSTRVGRQTQIMIHQLVTHTGKYWYK